MAVDNTEYESGMAGESSLPFWSIDRFRDFLSSDDQRAVLLAITFASGQREFASSLIPQLFEAIENNIGESSRSDDLFGLLIGRAIVAIASLLQVCKNEDRAIYFERASNLAHELCHHSNIEVSHHANYALAVLRKKQQ